jgi:hypothetical protein
LDYKEEGKQKKQFAVDDEERTDDKREKHP